MPYRGAFLPGLCWRGFSVRIGPRGALWRLVPGHQRGLLFNRVRVNVLSWPRGQYWSHGWWGEGNGNPLQYSCLGNPTDRGGWQATVHIVVKSWIQFSSVAQSCPTLCDPMDCSTPGFLVHHQLPEFTQTHVHWVGDAIQPSHPLSSPSPAAFNPSQHQGLFQWVSSSHQVAKVLEFQLQHQSFQWFRTDFF